jgi:hypothetical protein
MSRLKTFWCERLDEELQFLRRYRDSSLDHCPAHEGEYSYHQAMQFYRKMATKTSEKDAYGHSHIISDDKTMPKRNDPLWPTKCDKCDFIFEASDHWQIHSEQLYRRVETGEVCSIRDIPPGGMWDAWWMPDRWKGADGMCLMVKLPNGREWMIDSVASNCDSPCVHCGTSYNDHSNRNQGNTVPTCPGYKDSRPEHKCWVRHGVVPEITVDKNGISCGAGAGSISSGGYHGFLRAGYLED